MQDGRPKTEPLAIVGMACRFSGGLTNPEKLWDFVADGRSAWSKIPDDRFNLSSFYHPQPDKASTSYIKGGYFLDEDVGLFDPAFFNFSSEAAAATDPQIRILLELTFESMESAGIPMETLAGSNTAVYAGSFTKDYHDRLLSDPLQASGAFVTGNYAAMAANRISHFYNLKGPSTAIDTGCSTSLVGLHLACQSLRLRESDCAIVGGACINLNPDFFAHLSSLGSCGPDGKCYAFDHRVQGYGRGEGIAVLIVKRLEDAVKAGDPIRAVIRETAVNQDGRTATITSPDLDAQQSLIRACYQRAGLDPRDTSFVEAHGTGTKVGDKTEATAIGTVISEQRKVDQPVYIASVKTNVGHTEAVSGLAAIIKTAKSLEVGKIAPSINFEKPNPDIDFDKLRLRVPLQLVDWPSAAVRRASVNNFGYGGTNTHVILEEASRYHRKATNGVNGTYPTNGATFGRGTDGIYGEPNRKLCVLSAHDERSASRMAANYQSYLEENPKCSWKDLAYTFSTRRSRFGWSIAVTAESTKHLAEALSDSSTCPPIQRRSQPPRLGFVFNGQGAQWYGMGRELLSTYPAFYATIETCDATLKALGAKWSLLEELSRDAQSSKVNEVRYSMPLSCAVQLALVRLLESWGIRPTAVTGHSTGEVAAAFAAGALTLEEAITVTYLRGAVNGGAVESQGVSMLGSMMAVGLGPSEVEPYIKELAVGRVTIACYNSPASVTLSGDTEGIDSLEKQLKANGVFARKLKVQAAFHSHHMLPLQEEYQSAMENHIPNTVRSFRNVRFYSPVTGKRIDDANILRPEHWVSNMLNPVRFAGSFQAMVTDNSFEQSQGVDIIVEIGPHGALAGPVRQCLGEATMKNLGISYVSSLEREKDAVETMQHLAANLFQKGCAVNIAQVNFPSGHERCEVVTSLPTYPWNHSTKFWHESRASLEHRFRKHPLHDLLGVSLPITSDISPVWRLVLRPKDVPWVRDHMVQSEIVYPAAGYICMALEAIRQLNGSDDSSISSYLFRDVDILKALIIPDTNDGVELQTFLEPPQEDALAQDWRRFRIYSSSGSGDPWVENAHGLVAVDLTRSEAEESVESGLTPNFGSEGYTHTMNPKALFDSLHSVGINHGPIFRNITNIQMGDGKAISTMKVAETSNCMPHSYQHSHVIHPTTLDSVFQAMYPVLSHEVRKKVGASVPRSIRRLRVSAATMNSGPGTELTTYSRLLHHNRQGFHAAATVLVYSNDRHASTIVEVEDMRFQSLGRNTEDEENPRERLCFVNEWVESLSLNQAASVSDVLQATAPPGEASLARDLVRMVYNFVHDALAQLTPDDIANLEWHHKRFYNWMLVLEQQAKDNELAPKSSNWCNASAGAKQMFADRVAKLSVNGELAARIGNNLLPILRKQIAPLALMLEDQLLYKFYQHQLHFTRSAFQAGQLLRVIADENPSMKVLEIGAGTGGCTLPVLEALSSTDGCQRFETYDFTDISAGFFQAARDKFAAWDGVMSFSTLDIEKDAAEQGFELGSYDVIIAAQVLHATKNINHTLHNVRKLLKDGGKLILLEMTKDRADLHIIFGSLPGWWLSEEQERSLSPNMSLEAWDRCLQAAGFSGLDLNAWDCEDSQHHAMSCIMSTALPPQEPEYESAVTVVYAGSPPPQQFSSALMHEIENVLGVKPTLEELASHQRAAKHTLFLSGAGLQFDESTFNAVKSVLAHSNILLWVTAGSAMDAQIPDNALHLGLLRTARLEDQSKSYVSLDLDPKRPDWDPTAVGSIVRVFRAALSRPGVSQSSDFEYAERDAKIFVSRLRYDVAENDDLQTVLYEQKPEMQKFNQEGRPLRMHVDVPGLLDSIIFRDDEEATQPLTDGWVQIEPRAYGLNFRDIMTAMGMLKETKQEMGVECAGVITKIGGSSKTITALHDLKVGDRVCALTVHGHFASRVCVPSTSVAKIPEWMTFESAASMVIAFVTAYFALFWSGRAEAGESVLIHAAAGGVGQACIILAQWRGLDIFTTVGSQEKRDFLMTKYNIPSNRIFSSRDPSFAADILAATGKRGVDMVINSLAGRLLSESWNLLAPHGRFIEIGKRDIHENKSLEMEPFRKALSFIHVDVVSLADHKGAVVQRVLQQIVRLLDQKVITGISPVTTYPLQDVARAFRTMQAGSHIGKLVLVPGDNDMVLASQCLNPATLEPEATYMVVGGLTGIGLSISRLLGDRGARNLLLISRNAASHKAGAQISKELQAQGCRVAIENCDIGDIESLKSVVNKVYRSGMPAVKGVVHSGMVLEDSILERMTFAQWSKAIYPKFQGTKNLDELFGDTLSFFVMLSSISGVLGNPSQANYAAGGTYQDAVARHRAAHGRAAVTIDLGVVQSVGYVAETAGMEDRLRKSGHRPLSEAEVLGLVEQAIRRPRRSVHTAQITTSLAGANTDTRDRRLALLRRVKTSRSLAGAQSAAKSKSMSLNEQIAQSKTAEEAITRVQDAVAEKISDIFVLQKSDINPAQPLSKYGVDSLVAVELRNWLVPNARIEMSIFDMMGSSSLTALASSVVERSPVIFGH
ncbi:reducing type I polyketide synthase [Xylariaceae sp. FL1272]|nr:reducing type I polyketide synthase [Xylariaceae sp. FL1272]